MRLFLAGVGIGAWVMGGLVASGCGKGSGSESLAASGSASASASAQVPQTVDKVVEQLVTKYLSADDCTERVKFIMNPDKNREVLKQNYSDTKSCKKEFQAIDASDCLKPGEGRCSAKVSYGKKKNGFGVEYDDVSWYCISLDTAPKIDWRCSAGYNPVPLKTFKATYEKEKPSRFRVYAELSDYYNYEFGGAKNKMYSVKLSDERGENIAGYVEKETDLGKQLFELLKDGKSHAVVLELTYKKRSQASGVVNITNMVGKRWREYQEELQ
jgi:hypothetical protein